MVKRKSAAPELTVDDIDHLNDLVRSASMLNVLTLHTLEADHVLVVDEGPTAGNTEDSLLTEAVCESVRQVGETLKAIHDFVNGRWEEIRAAAPEKGGRQ